MAMPGGSLPDAKALGALAVCSLQNAGAFLLMRYSKLEKSKYSNLVAVGVSELIKLGISLLLYAIECGGAISMARILLADVRERPAEWGQLAVPAVLYTIQNVLLYVGAANLDASQQQIVYQSKILFTALFSVLLLGRSLGQSQWLSMILLVLGVLCVQGAFDAADGSKASGDAADAALGLGAMLGAAACSAFASVYFESKLKGARKPSLWLRNVQLASYSGVIAALAIVVTGEPRPTAAVAHPGLLHGFTGMTWAVVLTQSVGGIVVAVTIKYADNILRNFSLTVSVILGTLGSYALFGLKLTSTYLLGVVLVLVAMGLFSSGPDATPVDACRSARGLIHGYMPHFCAQRCPGSSEQATLLTAAQ
tara:strand:+ start:2657 stop:3754 length:1098 start_codon:yes stop_codon:yes gene_type:complete